MEQGEIKLDWLKWIAAVLLLAVLVYLNMPAGSQVIKITSTARIMGSVFAVLFFLLLIWRTAPGRLFPNFVRESRIELRKVVWPTRKETLQITRMVVITVLIVALMLWIIDSCASSIIHWIIGQGGKA